MVLCFMIAVLLFSGSLVSMLGAQQVHFDVTRTVACQDVSDSRDVPNGLKEVKARISVSALAYLAKGEDIDESLYRFDSTSGVAHIVDYLPRTTMGTHVAGNVHVQRSNETTDQINLNVSTGVDAVHANGGGSRGDASRASFEYELIPPRSVVAAVGTTGRGTGVYFKLHRTPQVSLEGSREFQITLQVPSGWRGGYLQAYCQSVRRSGSARDVCGAETYVVPLYLENDTAARKAAEIVADAERELYATARKYRREIQRRSLPTIAHELSLVGPKIPKTWLQQVVGQPPNADPFDFERRLPTELRGALVEYRQARSALSDMRLPSPGSTVAMLDHRTVGEASESLVRVEAWSARSN